MIPQKNIFAPASGGYAQTMGNLDLRIENRYKLERKLGWGGFGNVYLATDLDRNELVAVKLRETSVTTWLQDEATVYDILGNSPGIPKLYAEVSVGQYSALILEYLGPSLDDIFSFCDHQFSLKTVLMLLDQLISRFEYIHSKGVVHRDVKPDNILMGRGKQGNLVYIADFGTASQLTEGELADDAEKESADDLSTPPVAVGFIGTSKFASTRSHQRLEQSPRDDLESLGYVGLYLLRSRLPWDDIPEGQDRVELTSKMKASISIEDLCASVPEEFSDYFRHVRSLGHRSRPNYRYLRRILRNLFKREGFEYDHVFDWTIRMFLVMNGSS